MNLDLDLSSVTNLPHQTCWVVDTYSSDLAKALYVVLIGIPNRESRFYKTCRTPGCVNPWHHQWRLITRKPTLDLRSQRLNDLRDIHETVIEHDYRGNRKFPDGWATSPALLYEALGADDYTEQEVNDACKIFGSVQDWEIWCRRLEETQKLI